MKGIGRVGPIVAFNPMLVLGCMACFALPALADSDPNACRGVDFDMKRPLVASQISVRPHVNFVKGSDDDGACPTDKDVCRKKAYLVRGDVVFSGRAQDAFTCASYQSFHTRKQNWTVGWLPTSSLTPLEPMGSPKAADWIGTWSHPRGTISIKHSDGGKLSIEGEHIYPAAQKCSHRGARRNGGSDLRNDRFCRGRQCSVRSSRRGSMPGPHAARRHVAACGRQHAMRRFHGHLHRSLSPRLMRASL
jgi:hypothetical protein